MLPLGGTFNVNRDNNKNDINNKITDNEMPEALATPIPFFLSSKNKQIKPKSKI